MENSKKEIEIIHIKEYYLLFDNLIYMIYILFKINDIKILL